MKSRTRLSDFTFTFYFSCIGEGNGKPLQCSCLENPRDRGAWWTAVYGVAQSWTGLKQLSSSSSSSSSIHLHTFLHLVPLYLILDLRVSSVLAFPQKLSSHIGYILGIMSLALGFSVSHILLMPDIKISPHKVSKSNSADLFSHICHLLSHYTLRPE